MAIDYKKELERALKDTILIHDPKVLIETILRMLVEKTAVAHASTLLYDEDKDSYILAVSDGSLGLKIPVGLARIDKDDPLVYFFRECIAGLGLKRSALTLEEAKRLLNKANIKSGTKLVLKHVLLQMQTFNAHLVIPSYFQGRLLGLLLLGRKKTGRIFLRTEIDFLIALSSTMAMALRNARLFKELESQLDAKAQLFVRVIIALAAAIEAKDYHTHGHTARVTNFSLDIAKAFNKENKKVFDDRFLEDLYIASLLHDIGKIGIPENILNKKGILDDLEKKKMQEHPLIGAVILHPIRELKSSILGVKYHHERYDGAGYPEGLKGDAIPSIAAIISVADTFDALTTDRPYKQAIAYEEALREISHLGGTQLSPKFLEVFLACLEKK